MKTILNTGWNRSMFRALSLALLVILFCPCISPVSLEAQVQGDPEAERADTLKSLDRASMPEERTTSGSGNGESIVLPLDVTEKNYREVFDHSDMSAGVPTVKKLHLIGDPAPNFCAPAQVIKSAKLLLRLKMGEEDYEFGRSTNFDALVEVKAEGKTAGGTLVQTYLCTLQIRALIPGGGTPDQIEPEQLKVFDFTSQHASIDHFDVSATYVGTPTFPGPWTADLQGAIRLDAEYREEFEINPKMLSDTTLPAVELIALSNVVPSTTNPVTFQWRVGDAEEGCSDSFPSYELQLLRLYNVDAARTIETNINTIVDWSQALSIETASPSMELTLTVAEGRGYYAWRVRPIGSRYPGGIANDLNWGVWSAHLPDGEQVISATTKPEISDAEIKKSVFFYDGIDEDLNWIYSRNFSEGDEGTAIGESIAYATSLLQAKQGQVSIKPDEEVLISQSLHDFSGREALTSLPAPVPRVGFNYYPQFLKHYRGGGVTEQYTALNFDFDAAVETSGIRTSNYTEPDPIDSGFVHRYYSDINDDLQVPNADGYAYARTLYYADGSNRIKEQSTAGAVHRLRPSTSTVHDRTVKVLYGAASDGELIAMFGDEAPSASTVQKVMMTDANKVTSIKYISKDGQTLATCMAIPPPESTSPGPSDGLMDELNLEKKYEQTVHDTLWQEPKMRRIALPLESDITLRYSITPNQIASDCGDYCSTCDYKVYFYVHNLDDHTLTKVDSLAIPQSECGGGTIWPMTKTMEWHLDPGTYVVERKIVPDNPVNPSDPSSIGYMQYHADSVRAIALLEADSLLGTVRDLLDSAKLTEVYAYLDTVNGGEYVDGDNYVITTSCCTITIPKKDCDSDCPTPRPDFEQMLYDRWGTQWGGSTLGVFFKTRGNPTYPAVAPFASGVGAFNAMIDHMIDEDGYDCGELLGCWEIVVEMFGRAATTDGSGDPSKYNPDYDLLDAFLKCAGKKYIGTSDCPYGTCGSGGKGYLEYAYKYFRYDGSNQSATCEASLDWANRGTWGQDPHHGDFDDKKWEKFYECVNGRADRDLTSLIGKIPDCAMFDTTCAKDYAAAVQDTCESVCQSRYFGFVASIKEAYHKEGKVVQGDKYLPDDTTLADPNVYDVSLHEVHCRAQTLVDHCETGCTLTIFRHDSAGVNKIDSIGSTAEQDSLLRSMTYTYILGLPDGSNNCADTMYKVRRNVSALKRSRMIVKFMNFNLRRLKRILPVETSFRTICDSLSNFFYTLVGPGCNWFCQELLTKKDEGGILTEECTNYPPDIFSFQNTVSSTFVLVDTCKLYYKRVCKIGETIYIDSAMICDNLCASNCDSVTTCFRWLEPRLKDTMAIIRPLTCAEYVSRYLRGLIDEQVDVCAEQRAGEIREEYRAKCISPENFGDTLSVEYGLKHYHFTLYYYDRAGHLIRTVPPNGVDLTSVNRNTHPSHTFVTSYEYNSLGQIVSQNTPDGGTTKLWYNNKGQLRFSQTARQLAAVPSRFSYVKYDALGRAIESGEALEAVFNGVPPASFALSVNQSAFPVYGVQDRTYTIYTTPAPNFAGYLGDPARQQRYLQNRISYTFNDDGITTYYSYDPHGNVEWMNQWIPGLGGNYIGYKYDLISNKVLEIHYDSTIHDMFHHRYTYDAMQRLVKVETSRDGSIWDRDASYSFYRHGPIRGIDLGEDKLQGQQYTYTIHGWVKGINHPSLDPALDPGGNGNGSDLYAPDAFGMTLGYYQGDFLRKKGTNNSPFNSATTGPTGTTYTKLAYDLSKSNLYNGNITSWTSNITPAPPGAPTPLQYEQLVGYTFRYDRLNRLMKSDFWVFNGSGNTWPGSASTDYHTETTYDPAGNILTMLRTGHSVGGNPLAMDSLIYTYPAGKNTLTAVKDKVANTPNYTEDIDNQVNNNYTYDADGNLTGDLQEGEIVRWNASGKVRQVRRVIGATRQMIYYDYNAAGNRVKKVLVDYNNATESKATYYVRDANEQVLAIYTQDLGTLSSICVLGAGGGGTQDFDGDGIRNSCDNCPNTYNPWQEDYDRDGVGDVCDICPLAQNPIGSGGQPPCVDPADPPPPPAGGYGPGGGSGIGGGWKPGTWEPPGGGGPFNTQLAELLIYGHERHDRFATVKPDEVRDTTSWEPDPYTRTMEKKVYELKDHLGDVRMVISDLKLNNGTPGSYTFGVDMRGYSNYYPFGMAHPNRNFGSGDYRFGYNSREMDNDWKGIGAMYDYGARLYDPRTARWLSLDPSHSKYPSQTPFGFTGGNPIAYEEIDGRDYDVEINHETRTITIRATYYTVEGDAESAASAQIGVDFWNRQSGRFIYTIPGQAAPYTINMAFSTRAVADPDQQVVSDKYSSSDPVTGELPPPLNIGANTYRVVEDSKYEEVIRIWHPSYEEDESELGVTLLNEIYVKKSEGRNVLVSGHEIGHSLGLEHFKNYVGIMNSNLKAAKTNGMFYSQEIVRDTEIQNIILNALEPARKEALDELLRVETRVTETGDRPKDFLHGKVKSD